MKSTKLVKPQRAVIRRYTTISATLDILRRKALPLLNPDSWDDRNDRYFMNLYKQSKEIEGLYALCAARCSETYHHWRIFTGGADGACLELRRKPLEAALDALPNVRYGEVEYMILDRVEELTPADVDRLPFVKRHGFTAEEEYRIILETDHFQRAAVSIELPIALIGRIYLNPWLPRPIAESIIETIHSIPGCEGLSVQHSQLIESGRWKEAGDKVIGRKKPKRPKPLKLAMATEPAPKKPARVLPKPVRKPVKKT